MIYRSKAPLRISFSGGGTDVPPYPEELGGAVLSVTINKYAFASLAPNSGKAVRIDSLDYDVIANYQVDSQLRYDGQLDLVKGVINRFGNRTGFDMFIHSDAPPGSGMGSSSSMVVALVGVIKEFLQVRLSAYEVAQLACEIERRDIGIPGGMQDQYAATFGGFNLIEFYKDNVVVNPLRVAPHILNELEYQLMLCYTGQTRLSAGLIEKQVGYYREGRAETLAGMKELKRITYEMKDALVQGRLYDFAELLRESGESKKRMNPDVTDPQIEELYFESRKHGVIGGKILGAGGGGFLLLFCEFNRKHVVAERLERMGGKFIEFSFEERGLQTWQGQEDCKTGSIGP